MSPCMLDSIVMRAGFVTPPKSDLFTSNSHLPVKKIFILRDPQTRDRDEIAEVYDNWKKVQGINTPYNTLVMRNGELQRQYFVSNISYNNNLSDSLFTPRTTDFGKK